MAKNRLEDSLVYILHHSKFELYGNLLTVTNAKKKIQQKYCALQ